MTASLSLSMIVKDEVQILGRVLEAARHFCDELVVVDTGSTDGTPDLAASYGAKVYHFDWVDDFSAARNAAFDYCQSEWVIWLDADDVVTDEAQRQIRALKADGLHAGLDAVVCSYQIAFSPQGLCTVSMPRERILRRDCGGRWMFPIHESFVLPDGATSLNRLDIAIEHRKPPAYVERSSHRNLNLLARSIAAGDETPRTWYYYAKELYHHERVAEARDALLRYLELEDATAVTGRYQALHRLMVCCLDLQQNQEAIAWGFQALQVDSSRAEALTELGVALFRQRAFDQAIPFFTGATAALRPQGGQILEENYTWRPYHYLSLCYEALGDYPKALESALKALPTMPDQQVLRENLRCFAAKL